MCIINAQFFLKMEFCVLVLLIGIHNCYGVSVCGNVPIQGKSLSLSHNNGGGTGCWCILGLIGSNNDTVFVTERVAPLGCQYMLQFNTSNGFSRNYSCTTYGNFSFPLQHGGSVMIQLVDRTNTTSSFSFDIMFSTKSSNLSLTCNLPISTTIPPATATIVLTTPAPIVTTSQNASTQPYTRLPVLSSTVDGNSDNEINYNTNNLFVIAIIGWSVAGVFIISTVVLILCCLAKRKAVKNTNSPVTTEYVDISTMSPNITDNTTPPGDSSYVNVSTVSPIIPKNTYDRLNYSNNNINQSQIDTEYTVLNK